jgi:serine/threonine-protein kinase HipA
MCQALNALPTSKYQSEGGPGAARILELLRTHGSHPQQDMQSFVDANIFNWLIGGTDAHAKNYSVLIGSHGQVRLAPLYDVASAYAYRSLDPHKLKLAMKVGNSYRIREIGVRHWQTFAKQAELDDGYIVERARVLARAVATQAAQLGEIAQRHELDHPIVERLMTTLSKQAELCERRLY